MPWRPDLRRDDCEDAASLIKSSGICSNRPCCLQNCPILPSELDGVLAVGAVGNASTKAYYSNYGSLFVDVSVTAESSSYT